MSWPGGTVRETVDVAPAAGVLVVEVGGAVEVVSDAVGADDVVVVVRACTASCRPLEQLVVAIAREARRTPVVVLRFRTERIARRRCQACGEADAAASGVPLPQSITPGAASPDSTPQRLRRVE